MSRTWRYLNRPIFLMASERSGGTLISQIFNSHSRVASPSASHIMRYLFQQRAYYGDLAHDDQWRIAVEDMVALQQSQTGEWASSVSGDEVLAGAVERRVSALASYAYAKEQAALGKDITFVKENHIYDFAAFIISGFPDARFVHLVRDPRDMALSWMKSASIRGGVVRAARTWARDQSGFSNMVFMLADARIPVARLTYESLLDAPQKTLAKVCEIIDLDFEEKMLSYHEDDGTQKNARQIEDWRNTASPLMAGNYGKWGKALREDQIALVEAFCGGLMPLYGYQRHTASLSDEEAADLEARLSAEEPMTKPAYDRTTDEERRRRGEREAVLARMAARRATPPHGGVGAL